VTEESTRESVVAGNDVTRHVEQIEQFEQAGFDELFVANMGPHALEMIEFYGKHVLPAARATGGG
jgi:hypothetical protein